MALLGMGMIGNSMVRTQLIGIATKVNIEAVQLGRRMATEMVKLASADCPQRSGRLRSTIRSKSTGLYSASAEVGKGVPYTLYAEFYVTKGHEIREPSGRFWYPNLGKMRTRLRSGLLDKSGRQIIQVSKG